MSESERSLGLRMIGCAAWVMCLTLMTTGCRDREKGRDATLLNRFRHVKTEAAKSEDLAEKGRVQITEECAKQPYENAKKGLIVSEVGLHEDVFMLRDLVTYGGMGFSLDESLRLESLLRAEVSGGKHPAEQAACIQKFEEHLESLSDPLVEGDQRLKELDASAFKEAERRIEEGLRGTEKPVTPKTSPHD